MSHDRITRHEMKHDEFVDGVANVARWIEDHRSLVVRSAGALVAALVLWAGGQAWWQARQEKALVALAEVERRHHAAVAGEQEPVFQRQSAGLSYAGREEKFRAVLEASDALLAKHRFGPAARQARYYRALALRELGRTDEAVAGFRTLLDQRLAPLQRGLAQVALAETYEAAGRWSDAAATYAALSADPPDLFPPEMALLGQARCLEREQRTEEARALYRRIVDAYPGSPYATEAEERLRQFG